MSAFFFFTFQSGQEEGSGKAVQQRVRVLENYSVKTFRELPNAEGDQLIELEGHISLQGHKKKLSPAEQEDLELTRTKVEKYHQLLDLEARISLHKEDPAFPRESYQRKVRQVRDELRAIDKNRSLAQ